MNKLTKTYWELRREGKLKRFLALCRYSIDLRQAVLQDNFARAKEIAGNVPESLADVVPPSWVLLDIPCPK